MRRILYHPCYWKFYFSFISFIAFFVYINSFSIIILSAPLSLSQALCLQLIKLLAMPKQINLSILKHFFSIILFYLNCYTISWLSRTLKQTIYPICLGSKEIFLYSLHFYIYIIDFWNVLNMNHVVACICFHFSSPRLLALVREGAFQTSVVQDVPSL